MKKIVSLSIMLLFVAMTTMAETNKNITNYYKSDYKFGAKNWEAKQQKNGIMYFANMNGLLCFDGQKWERSIFDGASNNVHSITIDDNGNVYIASQNEFGIFRASETGLSKYESLSKNLGAQLNFREIWHISKIGKSIVFQAENYLFIYNNDTITTVKTPDNIKYSTVIENTLYMASVSGDIYTLMGSSFIKLSATELLKSKSICSIIQLINKELLFITENDGAYIYKNGEIQKYEWDIDPILIKHHAFCAKRDNDILAIGTVQNGLITYNLSSGETQIFNMEEGLQNNTVLALEFDTEHNIWLCLDRGISYLKINTPFENVFAKNNPYGSGYCSLVNNNLVYMGTNQGLFVGKYESNQINGIQIVEGAQGQVYALKQLDNCIFSCQHNGLFEINGTIAEKTLDTEGIWNIQKLKKNPEYLIVGHYKGFLLLKKNGSKWIFSHMIEGFEESCRLFEQDDSGAIWMSHGLKGVYKIELSDDLTTAQKVIFYDKSKGFKNNLHISVFDIDNKIVFAAEDGLYTYDSKTDSMTIDEKEQKSLIGAGQYYYFYNDGKQKLWMLKENSIFSAQKDVQGNYSCTGDNGFIIPEDLLFEYFTISTLDNNHILVSNEEGFTIVNLDMTDKNEKFDIYIRNIYSITRDTTLTAQYLKKEGEHSIPKIDYADNSIRITFGSVCFSATKNNQILYSTRLVGYEDKWSEPSAETAKEYTNLREGRYTIQIKSFSNGVENGYTEYTFDVNPPIFRTFWAYLIYSTLFLLLLLILYKYLQYKEKQVEKKKNDEILEQQKIHERESKAKENEIVALKNEQLEKDITFKTKELAGYTMNLVRKNEILIDIKDELTKAIQAIPQSSDQNKNAKVKLSSIIKTINENIEHDDDWKKFEENFDAINQDFLKRLGEQYTGLTMNDKKLCAYLRMNLVSKDIAPLLNISLRGVEIGRYRLRKKLNLSRDTNITEFLQNF